VGCDKTGLATKPTTRSSWPGATFIEQGVARQSLVEVYRVRLPRHHRIHHSDIGRFRGIARRFRWWRLRKPCGQSRYRQSM